MTRYLPFLILGLLAGCFVAAIQLAMLTSGTVREVLDDGVYR